MSETLAYLSLGSNLGNRARNLRTAIAMLPDEAVRVRKVSHVYETEPVDYLDQPWFLNCVVEAETLLAPSELLQALQNIERKMRSKKQFAKGPRIVDLDILLYNDKTVDVPGLQVPHPRMLARRFVLVPLAEIAPGYRHPTWNSDASGLLARVPDKSIVRRFTETPSDPG